MTFSEVMKDEANVRRGNGNTDVFKGLVFCLFMAFAIFGEFITLTIGTTIGALTLFSISYFKCSLFLFGLVWLSQICNKYAKEWNL